MDGGVVSPTSADLLAETDITEVIVPAPMASSDLDVKPSALEKIERLLRQRMTRIVKEEVKLLEAAGKRVRLFTPKADDLHAFGYNMMDSARRSRVFEVAMNTTKPFGKHK